ncbi:MAG TPA: 4-hydroxythreonine-4-phosphate dehydrogenase PdxA [Bacteroidota bacterium]|nr:4-hydroxythreonine-4-phosphate dehydrogenase PdxA [Bacteroidota bacterium]
MKPVIAITAGDFNGIGPELALKAATHSAIKKICSPLLVGPLVVFEHVRSSLRISVKLQKAAAMLPRGNVLPVVDVGDGIAADIQYGSPTKASGKSAGAALENAVKLCLDGKAEAMVTAPVSKEGLHLAGYNFPGQTEMIALFTRSHQVAMMLVSNVMRVGLVTIHVPLKEVADRITKDKVVEKINIVHASLRRDFGIKKPSLAILGLNPHAGEHGDIGDEEISSIQPAIEDARALGISIQGPFSADAFFGTKSFEKFDGIIAMYHDQGLIPLKMSSFGKGVNFSAGLSIVRTSPDHGTAYEIAGKGTARLESMLEAVKLAITISSRRK